MKPNKPALLKGTRDYGPAQMIGRNFIINTIKNTFANFGFLPLETPAIEHLDTLTGKYGEEGDQLIFKILNSGDFLEKVQPQYITQGYKKLTPAISEKALRYDLTVPFARYVTLNRHEINFPFKRYQIQPVWRADRPQKGRYREFMQCDADVVGTRSLICEAEIVMMIIEVLYKLGIKDFSIKINHRGVLAALAKAANLEDRQADFCTAIDKLDKIGTKGVETELLQKNFPEPAIRFLMDMICPPSSESDTGKMQFHTAIADALIQQPEGIQALADFTQIRTWLETYQHPHIWQHIDLDPSLARGLSYYTGVIFELKVKGAEGGSIGGGGRYDNLTGVFGLDNMPGVGFSFGVDRIYDLMLSRGLFDNIPKKDRQTTVLFVHFDAESAAAAMPLIMQLRSQKIAAHLYPEPVKIQKQMSYAAAMKTDFVVLIGSEEMAKNQIVLKNMHTSTQQTIDQSQLLEIMGG